MKKFLLTLLLFSLPAAASAEAWNPFGSWTCLMPGNTGEALVTIDPESCIFNIVMPQGDKFVCPFHVIIADEDKILIALLTPDRIAHPIELMKRGNGIAIDFEEIPVPHLECERPLSKAPIGH